jgi:hypothetical protein
MLVCSVSQLQRRAAVAADIAEAATAADSPGTGNVVFATLVDDPAAVGDRVDAYLGEIMRETASAAATVNAGLAYAAAIAEAVTAAELLSGVVPAVLTAAMSEASTALSTQDAAVVSAAVRAAMVPGVLVNVSTSREAYVDGTMINW